MKSRTWVLLGFGTVVLALATALVLGMLQQGRNPAVSTQYPQPGGKLTAQQASQVAQQWMQDWASDAQIIAVSAAILKSDSQGKGWTFQIYSRAKNSLVILLVDQTQIWVLREQAALYTQEVMSDTNWKVDSDVFLTGWWDQGGQQVWMRPEAQSMHLRLGLQKDGTLAWNINVIDTEGTLTASWAMRADTGEILTTGIPGG